MFNRLGADELASDLLKNGAKSWPEVAKILEIDI